MFVMQLIYLLGSEIARFDEFMTTTLMVFQIILFLAEMQIDVFKPEDHPLIMYLCYVGIFFERRGITTNGLAGHNISMIWQILFIIKSIINITASAASYQSSFRSPSATQSSSTYPSPVGSPSASTHLSR
jgi:hypothetical protein